MYFKIFVVLILVAVFDSESRYITEAEDIDNVFNLLITGDDLEPAPSVDDQEGEQPFFSDGIWKCGNCDVIDDSKVIYSETNDVEINNIDSDESVTVQVALSLENMQCVTVSCGQGSKVVREAGKCSGEQITLAVSDSNHFVVNVYGQ